MENAKCTQWQLSGWTWTPKCLKFKEFRGTAEKRKKRRQENMINIIIGQVVCTRQIRSTLVRAPSTSMRFSLFAFRSKNIHSIFIWNICSRFYLISILSAPFHSIPIDKLQSVWMLFVLHNLFFSFPIMLILVSYEFGGQMRVCVCVCFVRARCCFCHPISNTGAFIVIETSSIAANRIRKWFRIAIFGAWLNFGIVRATIKTNYHHNLLRAMQKNNFPNWN